MGHWTTGWFAYVQEQRDHERPPEVRDFAVQAARYTFENWQSEFLQPIWQVAGLAWSCTWVRHSPKKETIVKKKSLMSY